MADFRKAKMQKNSHTYYNKYIIEMIELVKYLVIFVVGALGDILVNYLVSSMKNPTGGLAGLKYFYTTLPWYSAAFWAGLLFVVVYFIADYIYNLIRPGLPTNLINVRPY
jgi:hypothetical protein